MIFRAEKIMVYADGGTVALFQGDDINPDDSQMIFLAPEQVATVTSWMTEMEAVSHRFVTPIRIYATRANEGVDLSKR